MPTHEKKIFASFASINVLIGMAAPFDVRAQNADAILTLRAESALGLSFGFGIAPGIQANAIVRPGSQDLNADSVYVVKAVTNFARSTLYALERAADGAQATVEMRTIGQERSSATEITTVMPSAVGANMLLSSAGDEVVPLRTRPQSARRAGP